MWRKFTPVVEEAARACFENPVISAPLTIEGALEGGGTSSRRVRVNGLVGWAKPARIAPDNASCVVNEKIAHDLAFELGLPVAPTQIITDHGSSEFPPFVSVAYAATAQPRHWNDGMLNAPQAASVASALGAMRVFHAWIDDHDHDWNAGNALIEPLDADSARPVFIDYSFSLTREWRPPAPPPVRPWRARNGPYATMDLASADSAVERILALDVNKIELIIRRIPGVLLDRASAEALILGLADRRTDLRKIIGLQE